MSKQIISIGFEIPNYSDNSYSFTDKISLMDADIIVFSPEFDFYDDYTKNLGKTCYSPSGSFRIKEAMIHWRNELKSSLAAGKTVIVLLYKKNEFYLHTGTKEYSGTGRNRVTTNHVDLHNNYEFLPTSIGNITTAEGKNILEPSEMIFKNLYEKFIKNVGYKVYIENLGEAMPIFKGKDPKKNLGAIYEVGKGFILTVPYIEYDEDELIEVKEDDEGFEKKYWNDNGKMFGENLVSCLLEIDKGIKSNVESTPSPEWVTNTKFLSKKEKEIYDKLNKNIKKIEKIEAENNTLQKKLQEEQILKGLLFEQGKPLENSVIKALNILGYKAENYDDGELELDQVIISPENNRFIGECEGKDNKAINVTKFRQLIDALNADFIRDEIETRAEGILFGNPERLLEPSKRKLDFTDKCKNGANREKIALVRTVDLYNVTNYLNENTNEEYRIECRKAIEQSMGNIVEFPAIPKTK